MEDITRICMLGGSEAFVERHLIEIEELFKGSESIHK